MIGFQQHHWCIWAKSHGVGWAREERGHWRGEIVEFADTREDVDGEVGEVSPGDHGFEISWSDNHLGIGVVEVDNSHIESWWIVDAGGGGSIWSISIGV